MLFLKSLAIPLTVPPVNLVILAVIGLIVLRFRPRIGYGILVVSIGGLLLLSMPGVSGSLLRALETDLRLQPPADAPPGAIVILSAELTRSTLAPDRAIVGRLTLERLRAGAVLARRTRLPILVTGGTFQIELPPIAVLMARSLNQEFRVPVRWVETASLDTWENATLSADILREAGIRSIYLVTHAWHMRRAAAAFTRAGLTVTAAPTSLAPPISLGFSDFVPRASSWETAYFAFHEWIGLGWYAFRAW